MLGKIEGSGEKGATEDEMVGWHHRLNGHEFEQADGQPSSLRFATLSMDLVIDSIRTDRLDCGLFVHGQQGVG